MLQLLRWKWVLIYILIAEVIGMLVLFVFQRSPSTDPRDLPYVFQEVLKKKDYTFFEITALPDSFPHILETRTVGTRSDIAIRSFNDEALYYESNIGDGFFPCNMNIVDADGDGLEELILIKTFPLQGNNEATGHQDLDSLQMYYYKPNRGLVHFYTFCRSKIKSWKITDGMDKFMWLEIHLIIGAQKQKISFTFFLLVILIISLKEKSIYLSKVRYQNVMVQ